MLGLTHYFDLGVLDVFAHLHDSAAAFMALEAVLFISPN